MFEREDKVFAIYYIHFCLVYTNKYITTLFLAKLMKGDFYFLHNPKYVSLGVKLWICKETASIKNSHSIK